MRVCGVNIMPFHITHSMCCTWRVYDYVALIIVSVIAAILGKKVRPHCREFEWSDPTINHAYIPELFPIYSVIITDIFIILVYVAGELLTRWKRSAGKLSMALHLNGWILAHAYGILLAFVVVDTAKLYAGRLRPDFIARLRKEGITEEVAATMTHDQLCRAAREGRLSFPSGHSASSFAGVVPISLYLMGLLRVFSGGALWKVIPAIVPMILPITVAISRTRDDRHNFDDILAGTLIGVAFPILSILLSFRPNSVGEWTLRSCPVDVAPTKDEEEDVVINNAAP